MSHAHATPRRDDPSLDGSRRSIRLGIVLAAAFGALWAALEIALGTSLRGTYDLTQVVWWRYGTHLLLLFVLFAWRTPAPLWRTSRRRLQVGRSLLMIVMPVSFVGALAIGASADQVWSVFWVLPLIILGTLRLLGRPVARGLWVAAVVVVACGWLMYLPASRPPRLLAVLLPLVTSLSFGLYVVATHGLRGEPLLTNLFYTAIGPFLALTPRMPQVWQMPSLHDAALLCAIGAIGLVALAVLDQAVAHAGPALVAPALGMHLPFAVAISAIHAGDVILRRDLLATALLAGVFAWVWMRETRA